MNKHTVLTGFLPRRHIPLGSFLCSMKKILAMQENGVSCAIVIADQEQSMLYNTRPSSLRQQTIETVKDLIAAGINPDKTIMYAQSRVFDELKDLCNIFTMRGFCEQKNHLLMISDIIGIRANKIIIDYRQAPVARIASRIAREIPGWFPVPDIIEEHAPQFARERGICYGTDAMYRTLRDMEKLFYRHDSKIPKQFPECQSMDCIPGFDKSLPQRFHEARMALVSQNKYAEETLAQGSSQAKKTLKITADDIREKFCPKKINAGCKLSSVWENELQPPPKAVWSQR